MGTGLEDRDLVRVEFLGGPSDGQIEELERAQLRANAVWETFPGHTYERTFVEGRVYLRYVGQR